MTTETALRLLQAASPHRYVQAEDAGSLVRPVTALASHETSDVVDAVGEALLAHEMESLVWQPVEAARLILVLVEGRTPSGRLMEFALNYLSMYFQELDEVIEACRSKARGGAPLSDVADVLSRALKQVAGVGPGDSGT